MNYVNFSAIAGVISPAMAEISDLRQYVKGDSSKCINEKKFIRSKFSWQGNERKENALWAFLAKSQPSGARGDFFLWQIAGSSGNSLYIRSGRSP